MREFWIGVISGVTCSMLLFICALFAMSDKVNKLESRQLALEEKQVEQDSWIEDNKTIMKTYQFFNESWQAIIELEERRSK